MRPIISYVYVDMDIDERGEGVSRSRRLTWDPDDPEDVKRAREELKQARGEGLVAYREKVETRRVRVEVRGSLRREWGESGLLLVPALAGG